MSLPLAPAAAAAMDRARAEARSQGHEFVGTEHLLAALIHEPSPELASVLARLQVAAISIRHELSARPSPTAAVQSPRELPMTPRLAQVLLYSEQEALAFEQTTLGAEHIFLGLLRDNESVAAEALKAVGVTLTGARDALGQACGREYRGGGLLTEPAAPAPTRPPIPLSTLPPPPSIALPPGARAHRGDARLAVRVANLERGLWEQQVFFGAMAGAAAGLAGHHLFEMIRVPAFVWALLSLFVGALVSAVGQFVVGAWVWGLSGLCLGAGLSSHPVFSTGGGALGFLVGVFVGLNLTRWRRPGHGPDDTTEAGK